MKSVYAHNHHLSSLRNIQQALWTLTVCLRVCCSSGTSYCFDLSCFAIGWEWLWVGVCVRVCVMGRLVGSPWGPSFFVILPIHHQHLICSLPYILSISSNGWKETKTVHRQCLHCHSPLFLYLLLHLTLFNFFFLTGSGTTALLLTPAPSVSTLLSSSNSAKDGEPRREIMEAGMDH